MKLLWATGTSTGISNAYGYSVHRSEMKKALLAAGVQITDNPQEAVDFAVSICHPHEFRPIPEKRNLLFTMNETSPLPARDIEPPKKADLLVVPSEFCRETFARHYKRPIAVCPEGFDPESYPFVQRGEPAPSAPFRFLFVGTIFQRKGFPILAHAWNRWRRTGKMPANCQLYCKTTGHAGPEIANLDAYGDMLPPSSSSMPRLILDRRNLPVESLLGIYKSAHAFILPTMGEGWGLTLTEAMATGAPCIWTDWSGVRDFADSEIGYPLARFKKTGLVSDERYKQPETYGVTLDEDALIEAMRRVYREFPKALELGRKASERMHSRFTWAQAAERFIEICEENKA